MNSKPEVAFRMSILNDGFHVTGTRVKQYNLLYSPGEELPLPRIDYDQKLPFKHPVPALYNDGSYGINMRMEEGFDESLKGKDFTFSAWFKGDKDPFFNRHYLWSPLIEGNHRWNTNTGMGFFLAQGEKSNSYVCPFNDSGTEMINKNIEYVQTHYKVNDLSATSRLPELSTGRESGKVITLIDNSNNPYYIKDEGDTEFHNFVFSKQNDTLYFFIDGKLVCSHSDNSIINLTFGGYEDQIAIMSSSDNINWLPSVRGWYNDICFISGACLWTKDFIPPTDFILNEELAILGKDKTIWGFTKMSNDYTVLSKPEMINLYSKTVPGVDPIIQDYNNVDNTFKVNKFINNIGGE